MTASSVHRTASYGASSATPPAVTAPLVAVAVAATLGVVVSGLPSWFPGTSGLTLAVATLSWVIFTLWPWTLMPLAIIGGPVAGFTIGGGGVRAAVVMHLLILAAGCLGLVTRRLLRLDGEPRGRTVADTAMLVLALAALAAATYGLARGNLPMRVLVTVYQVGIIPVHFFLATYTLRSRRRLRAAGILFLTIAGAITAMGFTAPGRHGGLIPLLAVPPLMVAAGQTRGWQRAGFAALAAAFTADVVLASYRGLWIAAAVAAAVMLIRGSAPVRRGVLITVAITAGAAALLLLVADIGDRASAVTEAVQRSGGYRAAESAVGLGVFSDDPLVGAGLGQSTAGVFVPGFAVTDVGPVYHAFYVMILANIGLVGLCVVLWPVLRALREGLAHRRGMPVAFTAMTVGFLASAMFASPTEGHWELGLLPALILLTVRVDPKSEEAYAI